ncbi:Crp/Fnr family transcriptional regulator [Rhizobium leguminosarum]|uniref:Crp/Fnr family transcriptional regulator n=1 Tax=Rhizobium leguminosarum TaxID=384 RepID=UPI001C981870|nr:Crp/Fnr family transcriptional regulator [Rhizobium leguminosarum]MBY5334933.1 Crp/Fnr family transcriptional regulator [Rhizobium leguminosarum]
MDDDQLNFRNELLRAMGPQERDLIVPHMEPITLDVPLILELENRPVGDIYILEAGLASIVARFPGGRDIEVGIVGREGMTGAAVMLGGDQSANRTFMQISGYGFKLPAPILSAAMEESRALRSLLLAYVQALLAQTTSTVLANGHAKLEERLARWLLMVHDRADGMTISLTHEFLAVMLGVRRAGVTVALHLLEGKGLIRSTRRQIVILNRRGLIEEAHGSYGAAEEEYRRLIGSPLGR